MNNVFAFMEDHMPNLKPTQEEIGVDAVLLVNRTRRLVREIEALQGRTSPSLGRFVGALLEDMRQDLEANIFVRDDKVSQEIHDLIWLIDCAQTVGELTHACYALLAKVQLFALFNSQIPSDRLCDYSGYDFKETT